MRKMSEIFEKCVKQWEDDKESQEYLHQIIDNMMHIDSNNLNRAAMSSRNSKIVGSTLAKIF